MSDRLVATRAIFFSRDSLLPRYVFFRLAVAQQVSGMGTYEQLKLIIGDASPF